MRAVTLAVTNAVAYPLAWNASRQALDGRLERDPILRSNLLIVFTGCTAIGGPFAEEQPGSGLAWILVIPRLCLVLHRFG
jgi:hypothetical protein